MRRQRGKKERQHNYRMRKTVTRRFYAEILRQNK